MDEELLEVMKDILDAMTFSNIFKAYELKLRVVTDPTISQNIRNEVAAVANRYLNSIEFD